MKHLILMFVIVVSLCGPALSSDNIAIVKKVQGKVTLQRGENFTPIAQGDNLQEGDVLITDSGASIGIIFHDGSVLSLKDKSYLRIQAFQFKPIEKIFDFHLFLKKGAAVFQSGKVGELSPESFIFEIPKGTIGIRGTKFLVDVR
ncbi:FecR family protein [Desulfuromusa kysingii]|uniref:FecR family protein n=1 Tax=Desulfuromusa kysingii TaxID=37625 RepID=A0A1H4CAJ1_9BACT|nr:FecR domain-containing protein [Desulfuromusa kysingii]SEA57340.1 FecR family protein [Desulfuromusa kysingii]